MRIAAGSRAVLAFSFASVRSEADSPPEFHSPLFSHHFSIRLSEKLSESRVSMYTGLHEAAEYECRKFKLE